MSFAQADQSLSLDSDGFRLISPPGVEMPRRIEPERATVAATAARGEERLLAQRAAGGPPKGDGLALGTRTTNGRSVDIKRPKEWMGAPRLFSAGHLVVPCDGLAPRCEPEKLRADLLDCFGGEM